LYGVVVEKPYVWGLFKYPKGHTECSDTRRAVKLELQERSELEFVSCNETQNSETNNLNTLKGTVGSL